MTNDTRTSAQKRQDTIDARKAEAERLGISYTEYVASLKAKKRKPGKKKTGTAPAAQDDTVATTLEVVRAAASQPAKKGKPNAEVTAKVKAEGLLSQIQSGERKFVFRDDDHREAIIAKLSSDKESEQIEGLRMFGPVRARTLEVELEASDLPDDVKDAVGQALTSHNIGKIKWGMYAATELLAGRPFEIRGLTKPAGQKTTSATPTTPTPKLRKEQQRVKVTGVVLPSSDDDVNLAERREADKAAAEELAADMADDEFFGAFAEYVRANDAIPEGERPEKWYEMAWMLKAIAKPTPHNLKGLKAVRKVFTAVTAKFREEQRTAALLGEVEVAMALYFNQGYDREVSVFWVRELFEKLDNMKGSDKLEYLSASSSARWSARTATDYVFMAFYVAMKKNPYAQHWFQYGDADRDECAERLWSELQDREAKRREKRDAKAGQHGHGHSGDVPGLDGSKPTRRVSKGSRSSAAAKRSRARTPEEKAATVAKAAEKDFVRIGNPNPQGPDDPAAQASRGKVVAGAGMTRAQKTAKKGKK